MAEAGRRRGCRRRRFRGGERAEARPQRPGAGGGGPPARVREEARPRRGAGGGASPARLREEARPRRGVGVVVDTAAGSSRSGVGGAPRGEGGRGAVLCVEPGGRRTKVCAE